MAVYDIRCTFPRTLIYEPGSDSVPKSIFSQVYIKHGTKDKHMIELLTVFIQIISCMISIVIKKKREKEKINSSFLILIVSRRKYKFSCIKRYQYIKMDCSIINFTGGSYYVLYFFFILFSLLLRHVRINTFAQVTRLSFQFIPLQS